MPRTDMLSRLRLLAGGLAMLLVLPFAMQPHEAFLAVERAAYDFLQSRSPKIASDHRVVLVDIDEHSLGVVAPWPWPRQTTAALVDTLINHYGVALLGLDMVFPDPRPGDATLRRALAHPQIILSQAYDLQPGSSVRAGTHLHEPATDALAAGLGNRATGLIGNHAGLHPPQPQVGHISPIVDSDGKVRRLYPALCLENECSLGLGFRLLQALYQSPAPALESGGGHPSLRLSPAAPAIPLRDDTALWIPFAVQTGGFTYLSAADVLQRRVPPEQLRNTVVLLGSTALSLGDRVATPLGSQTPGLEIHAQVIVAALDDGFIREMTPSPLGLLAACLGLTLIVALWRGRGGPWAAPLLCLALAAGYLALAVALFVTRHWLLPLATLPLFLLVLAALITLLESARTHRQLRRVAAQSRFFLPALIVRRLFNEREVGAGVESRQLTVLVTDLRGFTAACEGKSPAQVADMAQRCLETLSVIVARQGGIIEKFTGDGLMAIWGAESHASADPGEPARQAFRAARDMQQAIADLAPWFIEHGFPPLKLSIGINTGDMAVGVFGGAHRAWSAHGDAVNLATRIEQLTRSVGTDLLVGELTARQIGLATLADYGEHPVKGRSQPVRVYGLPEFHGRP